jgi:hypothetical protein
MKLKRIAIHTLFILNIFGGAGNFVHATQCSDEARKWLQNTLEGPTEALPISPASRRIQGELHSAGEILNTHQKLPHSLPDGSYIYVIEADGSIGYSARIPDPKNHTEPLASHRAVYERMKTVKNRPLQVIAAGEFEIRLGRVSEINNKSGTFRGTQKQLKLAETALHQRGLAIEEKTMRIDYATAKLPGKHNTELQGAAAYVNLYNNPHLKPLLEKLDENRRLIYRNYPSDTPGKIDINSFMMSDHLQLSKNHFNSDFITETREGSWMTAILQYSQDFTEAPYRLQLMVNELGYQKTSEVLNQTLGLEGVFNR